MMWEKSPEYLFHNRAKKFDKSIKLHNKNNWISCLIAWLLYLLSFGNFSRRAFLTRYATTLGNHIYFPSEWSVYAVADVLPHEARHVKQFRWLGCGIHPILGLPLAAIVYLLLPIPVLGAFGRFLMELDADKFKWRYMLSNITVEDRSVHEFMQHNVLLHAQQRAKKLSTAPYFWSIPYSWSKKLYLKAAHGVIDEYK